MISIQETSPQKSAADQQKHAAALCVIAHQGQGAGDEREQRRDGLQYRVELGVAVPRRATDQGYRTQQGSDDEDDPNGPPRCRLSCLQGIHYRDQSAESFENMRPWSRLLGAPISGATAFLGSLARSTLATWQVSLERR